MAFISAKIWTHSLVAGTLVIDSSYGLSEVSIVMTAGIGTILGNLQTVNGTPSTPIPLTINQAVNVNTGLSSAFIDYLEITTTGTVLIIGK